MIAAVILAAGESSRMGRSKQLLPYRGRSLIRHVADVTLRSACRPVLVVLGAGARRIRGELTARELALVENHDWREGIGSSIRVAVETAQRYRPPPEALVLLTCDQYRIRCEVIDRLLEAYRKESAEVVACEYAGTVGVPALFDAALFPELIRLEGDTGAKSVVLRHQAGLARVPWPDGAVELDTPEDYDQLLREPRE